MYLGASAKWSNTILWPRTQGRARYCDAHDFDLHRLHGNAQLRKLRKQFLLGTLIDYPDSYPVGSSGHPYCRQPEAVVVGHRVVPNQASPGQQVAEIILSLEDDDFGPSEATSGKPVGHWSCHTRVLVARPEYLLAMKCASMRLGEEFHDLDDVRYLLRYLNITSAEEALALVMRYFEEDQLLPKTRLALEDLLSR